MQVKDGILKAAIREAKKSEHHQATIGAVIFKGNKIISKGFNALRHCSKIKPQFKEFYNSIHAEQRAILSVNGSIKGYDILVVRLKKDGSYGLAKPCDMCQGFIEFKKLRYVYYTTDEGTIERERV